jgi:predicted transcriptional regulator
MTRRKSDFGWTDVVPTVTQPTSIRLPDKLRQKLRRWAKTEHRPLSVQIVWRLEKWCEWREAQEKKQ